MTRKLLITEAITLSAATVLDGLLLWMSLFIAGMLMLIPAAVAWLIFLAAFSKRMRTPRLFAEYGLVSCLLAAQVSLVIAIVMRVFPSLMHPLVNLI